MYRAGKDVTPWSRAMMRTLKSCSSVNGLERVQTRLRSATVRSGKAQLFEQLKGFVTGEETDIPYCEAGESLGMSEGAVRVAVHRLRRRFKDLLREEIEQTVADPAEVDDEIRFMLVTLATAAGPQR
jgi:hypothetical protein